MPIDGLTPPAELMGNAAGNIDYNDFRSVGSEFLSYFRNLADLQPDAHVLDVGCGCGRIAMALATFLNAKGRYEGVDVDSRSIDWANKEIGGQLPNFRFQRSDVFNSTYNPAGKIRPEAYRLPFADRTFDFAVLTSVFTHMLPGSMSNYLSEVARILKMDGRCFITMFLLNDECSNRISAGKSCFQFPHRFRDCCVADVGRPEDVVAYDEKAAIRKFNREGLNLLQPPIYGRWSGCPNATSSQDILIAQKTRRLGMVARARRMYLSMVPGNKVTFVREPAYARAAA